MLAPSRSDRPSCLPTPLVPTPTVVLVVGCSPALVTRAKAAAEPIFAVTRECDLPGLAGTAARWRPFAIVVAEEVVAFDKSRFQEIASAVGAMLIQLRSERVSKEALENAFQKALVAVEARRGGDQR